jgi:putative transposase
MSAGALCKSGEAFPWDDAPKYLIHDRDHSFAGIAVAMDFQEVLTAPHSPWQNAYVERLIGSIRRECLDHVVIVNAAGLRRMMTDYIAYYLGSRTHLSLHKDAPVSRAVVPPIYGDIVAIPQVGGLHHRYERLAA